MMASELQKMYDFCNEFLKKEPNLKFFVSEEMYQKEKENIIDGKFKNIPVIVDHRIKKGDAYLSEKF